MKMNSQEGLTLTELLASVAVIGILAALLLTAVSHVKASVSRIRCLNNVRQLGQGLQSFVADIFRPHSSGEHLLLAVGYFGRQADTRL